MKDEATTGTTDKTGTETSGTERHPNLVAKVGSDVRFLTEGTTGRGIRGTIKTLRASGITISVKGDDKIKEYLVQPNQVIKFYKDDE